MSAATSPTSHMAALAVGTKGLSGTRRAERVSRNVKRVEVGHGKGGRGRRSYAEVVADQQHGHEEQRDGEGRTSRRGLLRSAAAFTFCGTICSCVTRDAKAEGELEALPKCPECLGTGIVACDLCGGSGKWRALYSKRVQDKYQFVECPQCYGKGALPCSVCFGTGLRNVKGLLRRPEATSIVKRMQNSQLQTGEIRQLLNEQLTARSAAGIATKSLVPLP